MFIAVKGYATDGHRYIPDALNSGASVIVCEDAPAIDVPYVQVENARHAMAQIAANFYGEPKVCMIGVTGTNGKTSVTYLLKSVLEKALGTKVGLIGTICNMIGDEVIESANTTPGILALHKLLAQMHEKGCTHVVMEVSSHAGALDRIAGLHFAACAFTNLTEDHLDFHKTMENYCDAKAELFARCDSAAGNFDDPWFQRMFKKAACPVLTISVKKEAGLYAKNISLPADGVRFTAVCGKEEAEIQVVIPGLFTVYNVLTVFYIFKNIPRLTVKYATDIIHRFKTYAFHLSCFQIR